MQSSAAENQEIAIKNKNLNTIYSTLSELERITSNLNTPGNDIFATKNTMLEETRLNKYIGQFDEIIRLVKEIDWAPLDLDQLTISQQVQLIESFGRSLIITTNEIFGLYRKKQFEEAAQKMAQMDRAYVELRKALAELRNKIQKISIEHGDRQYHIAFELNSRTLWVLIFNMISSFSFVVVGIVAFKKSKRDEAISKFYQQALDQTAIVAATNPQGKITYANDKFAEVSGYENEELLGKDHRIINSNLHDKEFFKNLWKTILSGKIWTGEMRNKRKDGTFYWVDSTIIPMLNEQGQIEQLVAVRHDITARKHTEENLVRAKLEAESATKAKAMFLANMSHEIRTPLNGVLGMAALLADEPLTPEGRRHIEIMKNSGHALLTLINDILDFSKIEAGKLSLENVTFGLEETVRELSSLLEPSAQEKGVAFHLHFESHLPQYISTDVTRFRQVLTNLIGNAIKFTQQGFVSIQVIEESSNDTTHFIRVNVKDTGAGISPEAQKLLFKSFSQVDGSTTRRFGGTGLGLSICKGICEAMGGKIWAESAVGVGSVFSFVFQAGRVAQIPTIMPHSTEHSHIELVKKRKLKILVAEDNTTNQILVKKFLEKLSFTADIVNNGEEVIKNDIYKNYDVIFMDGHMPKLDGYETTKTIRQRLNNKEVPWIIALTASASKEDQERCKLCGMNDFVSKPFSVKSLASALHRVPQTQSQNTTFNSDVKYAGTNKSLEKVDLDVLLNHFGGDMNILEEVIRSYLATLPRYLSEIEVAIKNKNARNLQIAAHTLKGNISNFFLDHITKQCAELEDMGRRNNFSKAESAFSEAKENIEKLSDELNAILSKNKAA